MAVFVDERRGQPNFCEGDCGDEELEERLGAPMARVGVVNGSHRKSRVCENETCSGGTEGTVGF